MAKKTLTESILLLLLLCLCFFCSHALNIVDITILSLPPSTTAPPDEKTLEQFLQLQISKKRFKMPRPRISRDDYMSAFSGHVPPPLPFPCTAYWRHPDATAVALLPPKNM